MTLSRVQFWWFNRVSSWITRMLKSDLYVTDLVWNLLLLLTFPSIFALTWRIPWSICYSLEVCHYATKQPGPSRLRKDIHLHFNTSSHCTSPRLKSHYCYMHCAAGADIWGCGQSLDFLPSHSPHCTSIAATWSNGYETKVPILTLWPLTPQSSIEDCSIKH